MDGWSVYILRCGDGSLYTGCTNDLEGRLARHQAGKGARYTRSRLPVALVFSEPAEGRGEALRREAALKRLSRRLKLQLIREAAAAKRKAKPGRRRPRRAARGTAGRRSPAR